ncbi:sulfurtransferase [Marmoricola sp. RAF53]|uniref:sulfurtransferase n=1 Tax=Marmoricola sp. RAF53 TaxID=3233059 RepID=UPI003F9C4FC5
MTGPLISAADLGDALGSVTLLDIRYQTGRPNGITDYVEGHIPTALYVDLDTALAGEPGERGRHPLPDPDAFGEAMRRVGVLTGKPVVVYDDWAGRAAARAWWLLRHHGHPDVRVLDGGYSGWVAAGGPVEDGMRLPVTGDFEPGPGVLGVVEADDVLAFAGTGTLVDARDPARYRGEVEPIDPVAGHVPGAVNVPTGTNLRVDGTFRGGEEILALYTAAGVEPGSEIGVYCGSGVTAAHDILALAVAGIDARLYPGSWSEWVADPSRPVATGESS